MGEEELDVSPAQDHPKPGFDSTADPSCDNLPLQREDDSGEI